MVTLEWTATGAVRRSKAGFQPPPMICNALMEKPSEALIWIEEDGSARELTDAEKRHVDAEYSPFDGARPYVKTRHDQVNTLGDLSGYLQRTALPSGVSVGPAPAAPSSPMTPEDVAADLLKLIERFERRRGH